MKTNKIFLLLNPYIHVIKENVDISMLFWFDLVSFDTEAIFRIFWSFERLGSSYLDSTYNL